jgi:fibro-slime domain-containing protein
MRALIVGTREERPNSIFRVVSRIGFAVNRRIFSFLCALMLVALFVGAVTPAAARTEPSTQRLRGTIRDFRWTHPDFGIAGELGNGLYVAAVAKFLGPKGKPAFTGGPVYVVQDWYDVAWNPIPPHLASVASDVVDVAQPAGLLDAYVLDTFDSTDGPYDVSTAGPAPTFHEGVAMPAVLVPSGLAPRVTEYRRDGGGTSTVTGEIDCDRFLVLNGAEVRISGDVILRVRDELRLTNGADLVLEAGASLTIYAENVCTFQNDAEVNVSGADASRLKIYKTGTTPLLLLNFAQVYATVISPGAAIQVEDDADFHGRFTGDQVLVKNNGGFHIDVGVAGPTSCLFVNDDPGLVIPATKGAITSKDSFAEWFVDDPTVNVSTWHDIVLERDADGIYEYIEPTFYPIDDRLFGNEDRDHNHHFTYEIQAWGTYEACAGQFIELRGGDGLWMFINGQLIIDLGGVQTNQRQLIEMDRLGLTDGQLIEVVLFFANRNDGGSLFSLRTNMWLGNRSMGAYTGPCD